MPVLVRKEVVFVVVVGIYLQNAREILVGGCREKRFSQQPEWRWRLVLQMKK
jgi:hypothetical protein